MYFGEGLFIIKCQAILSYDYSSLKGYHMGVRVEYFPGEDTTGRWKAG